MNLQWFTAQVQELNGALKAQHAEVEIPDVELVEYQPQIGADLARYIDHTLLKPEATYKQICEEITAAKAYAFASICVQPCYVAMAVELLQGVVPVCTVVGFPHGATTTICKVMETRDAIANGAAEVDMVLQIGALKSGDYLSVYRDIARVKEAAGEHTVKVILETSLLDDAAIVKACLLAKAAGADFVKTSTGFAGGGATIHAVRLMRLSVGPEVGVKAAGGIRDRKTALAMLHAGANRLGTSAGIAIVNGIAGETHAY